MRRAKRHRRCISRLPRSCRAIAARAIGAPTDRSARIDRERDEQRGPLDRSRGGRPVLLNTFGTSTAYSAPPEHRRTSPSVLAVPCDFAVLATTGTHQNISRNNFIVNVPLCLEQLP